MFHFPLHDWLGMLIRWMILVTGVFSSTVFAQQDSHVIPGSFYVVASGLSKHFNVDPKYDQQPLNEKNWGLGLEYHFERSTSNQIQWLVNAGEFRDSLNSNAFYGGGAGLYEVFRGKDIFLQLGMQAALFYSPAYNKGNAFIAAMPVVSFGTNTIAANVVVIPRVAQFIDAGVVFLQLKMKID